MKSHSLATVTLDAARAARVVPERTVTLHFLLADGTEPPDTFRIFASGFIETTKGTFKFDEACARSCMDRAADYGNEYAIDYEHASLFAGFSSNPAEAGKAAGWFRPESRLNAAGEVELHAVSVKWTPTAKQKLKDREYRYISPTFTTQEDGSIEELINVALTNQPATKRMQPLMASRAEVPNKEKPVMKTLLIALGLAETATEAEALAALTKSLDVRHKLFALTGKGSLEEAFAVIEAYKAGHAQLGAVQLRVAEIEKSAAAAELEGLITAARADGKLAPAMVEWARTQSPKALRTFLEVAPKLTAEPHKEPKDDPTLVTLTAVEEEILRTTGTDRAKYLATKAAIKKETGGVPARS